MLLRRSASAQRIGALTGAAVFCLSLAACGGGDATDETPTDREQLSMSTITSVAATNTLQVGITIPGYPHKIDVYRPAGATKAIVFLHGRGGTTGQLAYDMGFNRTIAAPTTRTVNWDWLTRNGIIAVFPQGQVMPGTTVSTWSNYLTNSGQDDVAFLGALSSYTKAQFGATEVSLTGHSNGGAMTARMWCEGTTAFKAFVSMAGPMVSPTYPIPSPTCTPLAQAPYYIIVGGKDQQLAKFVLGGPPPTSEEVAAGLTDTILVSEWQRHQGRSLAVCGETPPLSGSTMAASGPTWNACGARVRYTIVSNADHPISSLEQYAGVKMVDVIAGFVASSSPSH